MSVEPTSASELPDALAMGEVRALLNAAHDAVVAMDSEGTIVEWNDAATLLFGWTRGEAVGRRMDDLLMPERFREAHRAGLERHLRTGETQLIGRRIEVGALRCDRTEIPIELSLSEAKLRGRTCFFAVLHDITSARTLVLERGRAAQVLSVTSDALVVCSPDGTIRTWNDGAAAIFGAAAEEVVGTSVAAFGLDEDVLAWSVQLSRGGARPVERRTTARDHDGALLDLAVVAAPLDGAGEGRDVLLVLRDVTRLARTEAELHLARDRFDAAFEAASIGMAVLDAEARVLVANDALSRLLGRSSAALGELRLPELAAPEHRGALEGATAHLLERHHDAFALDVPLEREGGDRVDVRLTVSAARQAETGRTLHLVAQVQHPLPDDE